MKVIFLADLNKKFLSVSELSELCNISRQAVLYYDKHNLLKPNFIDYNGYRYYHFKEYTKLEIILNLRKLGLSLEQIKEYLNNKSENKLYNLLETKVNDYKKNIEKAMIMIADMQKMQSNILALNSIKLDSIYYKYLPEQSYIVSDLVCKKFSIKNRIKILGKNNLVVYKSPHFKYFFHNWFIKKEDYASGNYKQNRYYYIPANINPLEKKILKTPAGNYLFYSFKGLYQPNSSNIHEKIFNYLNANHLTIQSDIFITSKKNFWLTDFKDNYVNTLSFCIEADAKTP